jgi:hypothetical protein
MEIWYDTQGQMAPAAVALTVNGKKVGHGCIERSVPARHMVQKPLMWVGDLGSPADQIVL